MEYLITLVLGLLSTYLGTKLKQKMKENDALKQNINDKEKALENGVLCLLRVKLIEYHDRYMTEGKVPSYAFENWILMYEAYKMLGGNGMIDHMKNEMEELQFERR